MAQPTRVPKSASVMTLLTEEDRQALDELAYRQGVNRSELVRDLIRSEIRRAGIKVSRHIDQPALFEEEGTT